MKETLLYYLNSHPLITCRDFIKIAFKLYNKNDNLHFLRDYSYCILHNKSGKTQFIYPQ